MGNNADVPDGPDSEDETDTAFVRHIHGEVSHNRRHELSPVTALCDGVEYLCVKESMLSMLFFPRFLSTEH